MTAVEWYFKQMQSKEHFTQDEFDSIYEQAKELEKKHIIDAHLCGLIYPLEYEASKQAEQYYNEQFKNK